LEGPRGGGWQPPLSCFACLPISQTSNQRAGQPPSHFITKALLPNQPTQPTGRPIAHHAGLPEKNNLSVIIRSFFRHYSAILPSCFVVLNVLLVVVSVTDVNDLAWFGWGLFPWFAMVTFWKKMPRLFSSALSLVRIVGHCLIVWDS